MLPYIWKCFFFKKDIHIGKQRSSYLPFGFASPVITNSRWPPAAFPPVGELLIYLLSTYLSGF